MTFEQVIEICKSYKDLGWAVQEQLDSILDDMSTLNEQNPNALEKISEFFDEIANIRDEESHSDAFDYSHQIKEHLEKVQS